MKSLVLDPKKTEQIKNFDLQVFVKKNESILKMPPLHFKEKLFEGKMKSSSKLTKQVIGEILTKRNNEILSEDENEEQLIRDKNATVGVKILLLFFIDFSDHTN